jgi:hypothetical protein
LLLGPVFIRVQDCPRQFVRGRKFLGLLPIQVTLTPSVGRRVFHLSEQGISELRPTLLKRIKGLPQLCVRDLATQGL